MNHGPIHFDCERQAYHYADGTPIPDEEAAEIERRLAGVAQYIADMMGTDQPGVLKSLKELR